LYAIWAGAVGEFAPQGPDAAVGVDPAMHEVRGQHYHAGRHGRLLEKHRGLQVDHSLTWAFVIDPWIVARVDPG
jgi:hypothetical protein